MSTPRLCIVVLNWNRREDTLGCLSALQTQDYLNFWIVVVDNGSSDGSVEAIKEAYADVRVIRAGRNLGYAEGNNLGIREALREGAKYILVLNNDTIVAPDMISHLVEIAEKDSRVGIVGPTIYFHDQPQVIWSAGGSFDWQRGKPMLRGLNERDTGQFAATEEVDYIPGTALLIRSETLRLIGGFDPRYFLYFEDNDLCFRIRQLGFSIVHSGTARVWHKISLSDQFSSPHITYYHARNRLLFMRVAGVGMGVWLRVLVLDMVRTLISWSLRLKYRGKREQRKALWAGLWDFWAGRFGSFEQWHVTGGARA